MKITDIRCVPVLCPRKRAFGGVTKTALGPAAYRHLVFTTDPERGALREIARTDGIATLGVPPAVGGRFSVLSPVGLLLNRDLMWEEGG